MPPTVQEELTAEFRRQTGMLEATIEQLRMEKDGSQQAFDKYRSAATLNCCTVRVRAKECI